MHPSLSLLAVSVSLAFAAAPAAAPSGDLKGTVLETIDAGAYTYLRLQTPAGEKWAAVPQTTLKKGAAAHVVGSIDMAGFESKTLKRTFDHIAFGTLESPETPSGVPHGVRALDVGLIKVEKAAGPDGRTIAEIYAQKKALRGKEVVVRGKVVKYNAAILNRNWAHLRDGSGSTKDGSDDLTVLLKDSVEVGQVIAARGKVFLDKDLGGMYKFAVVLEDAALVK